jgi:hypothetical protein
MICEEWDHAELEHPSSDPPPLPPVKILSLNRRKRRFAEGEGALRFTFHGISTENRLRMICEEWDHAELEHPSSDPPPLPSVQKNLHRCPGSSPATRKPGPHAHTLPLPFAKIRKLAKKIPASENFFDPNPRKNRPKTQNPL